MNKNLNLVNILKDCPKGTKLYSIIHGEIELEEIIFNDHYPIKYKFIDRDGIYGMDRTTADGRHFSPSNGECTLFPSKDQRDWSKFKVEPEMVDGEFYCCSYDTQKENSFIFIYKKHPLYKTKCYVALGILSSILFKDDIIVSNNSITELRRATEKEKEQLLNAIKIRNYKWDADKKELVRIEKKFDISTLQPFDKVLSRDWNDSIWRCNIYEYYKKNQCYPFITMNGVCNQCIPYNEDTKHLVGTTKMPPEKYINWEE